MPSCNKSALKKLASITTPAQAANYAACGFEAAQKFYEQSNQSTYWGDAVSAYYTAYEYASSLPVYDVINMLVDANTLATTAKALTGVPSGSGSTPKSSPTPVPEPTAPVVKDMGLPKTPQQAGFPWLTVLMLGIGGWLLSRTLGKKGGKGKKRSRRRRR